MVEGFDIVLILFLDIFCKFMAFWCQGMIFIDQALRD